MDQCTRIERWISKKARAHLDETKFKNARKTIQSVMDKWKAERVKKLEQYYELSLAEDPACAKIIATDAKSALSRIYHRMSLPPPLFGD
eukprot:3283428-Rhodomonas_salina.1